jgi:hypothetical protein
MAAAALDSAQKRLEKTVLIDVCGVPEPATLPLIGAAVGRLGTVYPSVDAHLDNVKRIGTVQPWSDYFERYLRYELQAVSENGGGVTSRTCKAAVLEDAAEPSRRDIYALWPSLRGHPVLLLRAARELLPGHGYIVSQSDAAHFATEVPSASVKEIDANHYGIITAEATAIAIASFLNA